MNVIARLAALAAFVVLHTMAFAPAVAAPLAATGPDGFGYFGSVIDYNLRDVKSTGARLRLRDDHISGGIDIGFAFSFYGNTYDTAYVSSNGFITFSGGPSNGCCTGAWLPSPLGPNNLIAGWWEDLDPEEGRGRIHYQTIGEAGSREFVVGFYNVHHWPYWNPVTFEMILHEGTNEIEFQWDAAHSDGGGHTVGIEDATGSRGLLVLQTSMRMLQKGYCIGYGGCGNVDPGAPADPEVVLLASIPEPNGTPAIAEPGTPTLTEPGTLALLALGLAGLAASSRRHGRKFPTPPPAGSASKNG